MFRMYSLYGSEGLPLLDMLSLGAWRKGLGCSGKILPPPPSPSPSSSPKVVAIFDEHLKHMGSGRPPQSQI